MPRARARRDDYNLTANDVADQLGLSRKTVDNWRYKGIGPDYRLIGPGKLPRYTQRAVDDYVDHGHEPAPKPRRKRASAS